jgi:hypothetical protein
MPDALGALGWIDFVNLFAQINSLIRAFGLTHIAVDALVGDHQCHGWGSAKVCIVVMAELSGTGTSLKICRAVARLNGTALRTPQAVTLQAAQASGMRLKWTA